jgi:hypothetical protein
VTDEPRDAAYWAANVDRLHVGDNVKDFGYNVEGRRVAGPQQGFGRLWQRTTAITVGDTVSPEKLIADWRANFGNYWPTTARFHGSLTGIAPGDVAPLETGPVTTGILVLYADETSFTFMTPEGHMFAAMITFSADLTEEGTRARIDILLRTSDPVFEAGWFYIRPTEDRFWADTLRNLAAAHGVQHVEVAQTTECVDRRRIWRNWTNVARNSGIRTVWHGVTAPLRRRSRKESSAA